MNAQEIITKEYGNSKNFMTPRVIRCGMVKPDVAYELSAGTGFDHQPIFGVSLVRIDWDTNRTNRLYDESKCLDSLEAAENYIKEFANS